ncbi:MAG: helix-turn-helix domain-containing protein [Rhodobacteraceae bacterium]|nr:helix-turn-helix domain-containing protein [Paracoccaceae bacterium]
MKPKQNSRTRRSAEGAYLRQWRIACGLTQIALGERIGRPQSAINNYECGRAMPPLPALVKLAEVLGFDPSDYLEERHKDLLAALDSQAHRGVA